MKVNYIDKRDISFNGFYNSNGLKKFLKFAENNGALLAAATSLTLSAIRPAAILATPKTDKENKKIACAKAITSTLLEFFMTLALSLPLVRAIGKINKNPQKYLKQKTIENLKENKENISESKAYTFANQLFKLGIGIAIAAPKAILNVFGIPYISSAIFRTKEKSEPEFNPPNMTFKGKKENEGLAKFIGKLLNNNKYQEFSKKHKDSNFPMHINAIKDTLATSVFINGVKQSKKIDEERKGALIYNSAIATGLSIISSYILDYSTKKPADKFIAKLKESNKNDTDLKKYIDGFKIAKPILIMGIMYYVLIPVISTFFGERADKTTSISKQSK